jgi:ferredoxin-NADP reductase
MQNQKIKARGPFGRFTLSEAEKHVMIAGGIGITPFRSIIKFATDTESNAKITLIYSNRTPEDIVFKEDLDLMEHMNENLEVIHTITRPEGHFWKGITGRVDEHMIEQHIEDVENSIFYVCGPPSMVDAMQIVLKEMGIADERIKMERFGGY